MLNGISLSSVMMVVGALLLLLAVWRLYRVFRPVRKPTNTATADATRQEPAIGTSDSERGE